MKQKIRIANQTRITFILPDYTSTWQRKAVKCTEKPAAGFSPPSKSEKCRVTDLTKWAPKQKNWWNAKKNGSFQLQQSAKILFRCVFFIRERELLLGEKLKMKRRKMSAKYGATMLLPVLLGAFLVLLYSHLLCAQFESLPSIQFIVLFEFLFILF